MSKENTTNHLGPLDRKRKCDILNDRELILNGGKTKIKWRLFSKAILGLSSSNLSKKSDDSFGEGKFKALFQSIEQEQIESGEHIA